MFLKFISSKFEGRWSTNETQGDIAGKKYIEYLNLLRSYQIAGCQSSNKKTSKASLCAGYEALQFLHAAGLADLSGRYYQIGLDDYCALRVLHAICRRVLQVLLVADFSNLCRDSPGKLLDVRLGAEQICYHPKASASTTLAPMAI